MSNNAAAAGPPSGPLPRPPAKPGPAEPGPAAPAGLRADGASLVDAAAAALAAAEGGPPVAIVVVVEPAALAGARLLRFGGGDVVGTLGDAALDDAAVRLADAALAGDVAAGLHDVDASSDAGSAAPGTAPSPTAAGAASSPTAAGAASSPTARAEVSSPTARTAVSSPAALYVETHRAPERLIVVGAGHIAVPLAGLGVQCGFRVLVLDDREEFATAERFADGVEVRRAAFDDADPFDGVPIDTRTSIALVTRGHRWDFDCLTRLLDAPARPRYIGMIGSRRRVRAAFLALRRAGVPRRELAAIHAPIGLDIGAETPAEIAVSIMAELIQVRRGGESESLARRARVLERLLPPSAEEKHDG